MKKIRIGNIGTLHDHSLGTMETIKKCDDIFEIVGFVPESDERYLAVKDTPAYRGVKRMTLDELFEARPDAMVIEGFETEQVHAAQLCIDRGIHVQIDKPAGANAEEFEKLLSDAKKKHLVVHMGYMYRYNPSVMRVKELVKEGFFGDIYAVEAQMNCEHPIEKRDWLGNFRGGMTFFLGCHLVDLLFSILGVPDEIIPLNRAIRPGTTAEDFGMALFRYPGGVSFFKSCAAEAGGFHRRQLVVCGTKGTVEVKPLERNVEGFYLDSVMTTYRAEGRDWGVPGETIVYPPFHRYEAMLREFAACVRGEMENPYSYEYELRLEMLLLASCGYPIDFKREIKL